MGIFTPHVYTWVSPSKGLVQIGAFIAVFLSVCYAVKVTYPDRPSYPREFEDGLQRELGGAGATRVSPAADIGSTTSCHRSRLTTGPTTGESTRRPGAIPGGGARLGSPCTCKYRPTNWTSLDSHIMALVMCNVLHLRARPVAAAKAGQRPSGCEQAFRAAPARDAQYDRRPTGIALMAAESGLHLLSCTCSPRWPCVFQLAPSISCDRHTAGTHFHSLQQGRYLLCCPNHSFLQRISTISRPDAVEGKRRYVQHVPREEGTNEKLGSWEPGLQVFTS